MVYVNCIYINIHTHIIYIYIYIDLLQQALKRENISSTYMRMYVEVINHV